MIETFGGEFVCNKVGDTGEEDTHISMQSLRGKFENDDVKLISVKKNVTDA